MVATEENLGESQSESSIHIAPSLGGSLAVAVVVVVLCVNKSANAAV
jgi:hypothetical protein